jgi:beta-phosphoglucomutase-like phosphatase (HAD superfamily)
MQKQSHKRKHLGQAEQASLLESIAASCAHSPGPTPPPVVVFDLDGTLMDNRTRTTAILRDLAETWRTKAPEAAERLLTARAEDMAYLLTDSLSAIGVAKTDLVAEAETFWRARFFGDDDLRHDTEVSGAVAFARACYDAGATLIYLTGRDLPLMGTGTFRSLRDLGFPIGVAGTELILKPDAAMPDEAFKRLAGPTLARCGRVIAIFDNEPANCNVLLAQNPEAMSVLIDTQHLPGAPPLDPRVHIIRDFRRS